MRLEGKKYTIKKKINRLNTTLNKSKINAYPLKIDNQFEMLPSVTSMTTKNSEMKIKQEHENLMTTID